MHTLGGRSIGLKATMSKEEMKQHLTWLRRQWLAEGFSEQEVTEAILSKAHPLLVGYYWHRFPESSKALAQALQELGYPVDRRPKARPVQPHRSARRAQAVSGASLARQFETLLS